MSNTIDISSNDDLIDVRDIIARVEQLQDESELDSYEASELSALLSLLGDLCGTGGDEQWHGDWYPVTMIRDSYFRNYAQQLAEDIGAIPSDAQWPCTCIDWDQAARELRMDYTAVEFDGVTYWVR